MVKVSSDKKWPLKLERHTAQKHRILKSYFHNYLVTRCSNRFLQTSFKVVIVDGFCGGGVYNNGEAGSPLVLLDACRAATEEINLRRKRKARDQEPIQIECLFYFNDYDPDAIEMLKIGVYTFLSTQNFPKNLKISPAYSEQKFEIFYPKLKENLKKQKLTNNILFILDQYGATDINISTLNDIMSFYKKPEIIFNISIEPFVKYLSQRDPKQTEKRLKQFNIDTNNLEDVLTSTSRNEFFSWAQNEIYKHFKEIAHYISGFSVTNNTTPKGGWRYWLIHLSNEVRAREVYGDNLFSHANELGHHGRSGLQMLGYTPPNEGQYSFDENARLKSLDALHDDIPRLLAGSFSDKVEIPFKDFISEILADCVAHTEDIKKALWESGGAIVKNADGQQRNTLKSIQKDDVVSYNPHHQTFFDFGKNR